LKEDGMSTNLSDGDRWGILDDPDRLIHFARGSGSDRKLRLFAVACCAAVRKELIDERSRLAVGVAERYADGLATDDELRAAREAARAATGPSGRFVHWAAPHPGAMTAVWALALPAQRAAARTVQQASEVGLGADKQFALLCCLFDYPWRPAPADRDLPRYAAGGSGGDAVLRLAQTAYDRRAWGALPVLADALEEVGFDDADALNHLRGPGPHARGCWVLDLILDKS
jgi:hypothetical protein